MQKADEIWTTSPWCKRMFEKNGVENVKVYMHGVDAVSDEGWQRKRRRLDDDRPVRFLHIGEPAPRKGGQLVYETFMELFGDNATGPTLTIKAHGYNTVRGKHSDNVRLIAAEMETFQLIDLVRRHDVLVYPSYGEGFGLIPLQALVTGMPVICTGVWAPYKKHLLPDLTLPSKLIPSPWPEMHPGNVFEPDRDALRAAMLLMADPDEFQRASVNAYANSFDVEADFDWLALTKKAFESTVKRFETE
jgi:glycosyltransferase involved in cell wall biosynthesis